MVNKEKNILIITLGNSDIQLKKEDNNKFFSQQGRLFIFIKDGFSINLRQNRDYEDWFLLNKARNDGQTIWNNYDIFIPHLHFPLIQPLFDRIKRKKMEVDTIVWVCTDQKDPGFQHTDTLYYAKILGKHTKTNFPNIKQNTISVSENVKDIDFQYQYFNHQLDNVLPQGHQLKSILLFPQGGIDQINHALTLQLLQKYTYKVSFYQQAEGDELKKLNFPKMFVRDLTKQKIIKHLNDYDFNKAAALILENQALASLLQHAAERLALRHDYIAWDQVSEPYTCQWKNLSNLDKNAEKLKDLVYAFKIDIKQEHFNDALTKLFTIYENMFKNFVDRFVGHDTIKYYNKKLRHQKDINEEWEQCLNGILGKEYFLLLKNYNNGKIALNNPNTMTYFRTLKYLIEQEKITSVSVQDLKKIDSILNNLRGLRNEINHSLGTATEKDISNSLEIQHLNMDGLNALLDKFVGTKGLGIYKEIKKKALDYYSI